jgi:exoribonuclease-2
MNKNNQHHRAVLQDIARRAMLERGLLPDFSTEALAELGRIQYFISPTWCSKISPDRWM